MQCQLAFNLASDGRLLVNLEINPSCPSNYFTATAFDDENAFIYGVVLAQLSNAQTVEIISAVLSIKSGRNPGRWIGIDVSEDQMATLGLECPGFLIGTHFAS